MAALKVIAGLILMASTASAGAVECRSAAGILNGLRVAAVRQANLRGTTMTLTGKLAGKSMPQRSLPCVALAKGVFCGKSFGPVNVSVMTNGTRMIEIVTDSATKNELASFAYVCRAVFRL
ncbi:hypothetical protein [Mesorhizobium sp. M0496]|uniref:hypothetical protein n=1 Tax=Mesorhizobium sp. M0496 TaxID=2956952 RepID=UPI00333B0AD2